MTCNELQRHVAQFSCVLLLLDAFSFCFLPGATTLTAMLYRAQELASPSDILLTAAFAAPWHVLTARSEAPSC